MKFEALIGEPVIVSYNRWFKITSALIIGAFLILIIYFLTSGPITPFIKYLIIISSFRLFARFKSAFIDKGYFLIYENGLLFPQALSKGLVIDKEWIADFLIIDKGYRKLLVIKFKDDELVLSQFPIWSKYFVKFRFHKYNGCPVFVFVTKYSDQLALTDVMTQKMGLE
jgi:hypothetical protein